MIDFDISGLDKMAVRLSKASDAIEKGSVELMNASTLMVQGKAKENAPVDKSTLRKSIQRNFNAEQGIVGSNLEYAKYQEEGTGIYGPNHAPIYPKTKKYLAWQNKNGQWFRARSVKGVKPRLFLFNALEYFKQHIGEVKDLAFQMIAKNL